MKLEFRGRKVTQLQVDGVDPHDHPKYCDAYFSYGVWADNDTELTEQELIDLAEARPDILNQEAFEHTVAEAEWLRDSMMDR